MKKIISLLAALVVIASLAGCTPKQEPAPENNAQTKSITDVRGRTVELTLPVEKAYYPYYYENLLTICGENIFEKISCTSIYDTENYSKTMYDIMMEKTPGFDKMQDVGSTLKGDFDIEKLISLKPDVAILANYQFDSIGEDGLKAIEEAGIPIIFIDYTLLTEEAHNESTRILGEIFGVEERAQELIKNYSEKRAKIDAIVEKIPESDRKTAFFEMRYNASSYKEYGKAYGKNGMMAYMGTTAGAKNIYEDIYERSGDVDPEYLFQQNPYAIFLDGGNYLDANTFNIRTGYTVTEEQSQKTLHDLVEARDGWANLDAVQNKRIYAVDNDIMRTMRDYVLIEYIGQALYPEEFKEFDPIKENREFIEKYVPHLPSDNTFMTRMK